MPPYDAMYALQFADIYERLRVGDETSGIGKTITFARPVRYDLPDNKLIVIG